MTDLPYLGESMLHRELAGEVLSRALGRPLDSDHCVIAGDGKARLEGRFHMDFFKGDCPPKGDWLVLIEQHADAPTELRGILAVNELHDAWQKVAWGHFRVPASEMKPREFLDYVAQPCKGCGAWPTTGIIDGRFFCRTCFGGEYDDRSKKGSPSTGVPAAAGSAHR